MTKVDYGPIFAVKVYPYEKPLFNRLLDEQGTLDPFLARRLLDGFDEEDAMETYLQSIAFKAANYRNSAGQTITLHMRETNRDEPSSPEGDSGQGLLWVKLSLKVTGAWLFLEDGRLQLTFRDREGQEQTIETALPSEDEYQQYLKEHETALEVGANLKSPSETSNPSELRQRFPSTGLIGRKDTRGEASVG